MKFQQLSKLSVSSNSYISCDFLYKFVDQFSFSCFAHLSWVDICLDSEKFNSFLIDRLQDGLERETSRAFFISDLSSMSETNPFSKTVSFEVVSRPPVSAAEVGGGKQPPNGSIQNASKQHVLISLLGGLGCIALVGAGVLWKKKKLSESNSLTLDNNSAMDKSDGIYGADEETMSYLNYIRKRYRDHDKSNKVPSSDSNNDNIAAVEQTGSYDDGEDSICNTVDSGSDNENKDADGLEDDLRSIY